MYDVRLWLLKSALSVTINLIITNFECLKVIFKFAMKMSSGKRDVTLEDQLFRNILYLGIGAILLLIIYDSFFTGDFHSVIIELVAGMVFGSFLVLFRDKPFKSRHKYLFSIILFIFINLGWLTGSGINLLNSSLYFLMLALVLILNDKKVYPFIFLIAFVNLTGLFSLQYFTDVWIAKKYTTEKQFLLNDYLTSGIFYFLGGYLITFLKLNYNREREKLGRINTLLHEKTEEVSYQNEELKMSKDVLDQMVDQLEQQKKELMDIKGSLEEKVNERTNDLMKLNERLLAQNQQLEQYAFITSHNLRAPIAQIKGLINVLPNKNGFDKLTKETLVRISKSAESLEKVFGDLSEIIKVEKSMQQPWQEVDLNKEIDAVVDSLKTSIDKKKISVSKPLQNNIKIKALRPYVFSVLHNILENAVKYSDESKDSSYIKIDIEESPKFHHISITDNGIGIDMGMATGKIFQMYQRFNNTHPGQGFGLFLVKSQMEAMEGKVELESLLGHGTTFNLYFPKR